MASENRNTICREITKIPPAHSTHFAAAAYLAVVVYPDIVNRDNRDELIESFWASSDVGWDLIRQARSIKEEPRLKKLHVDRRIAKAERVINYKRLPAAVAATAMMTKQAFKNTLLKPSAESRLTMLGSEYSELTDIVPQKFYDQVWDTTLPVLHLAISLHSHLLSVGKNSSILDLVLSPEWVRPAIMNAELKRKHLLYCGIVKRPKSPHQKLPQVQLLFEK